MVAELHSRDELAEIHGAVSGERQQAVIERGLAFSLKLQTNSPARRLNWIVCVTPRLDNSMEAAAQWEAAYHGPPPADIGRDLFLRVEVQQLYRLARINAILFGIRVYMASLADIATVPHWATRLHRVLRHLDPSTVAATGLPHLGPALSYLASVDTAAETDR